MIPLYNYIAAIKGHSLEQRIASTDIEKHVVNDDGVLVETLIKTVKFEDGVVVQLEEEFEQVHFQDEGYALNVGFLTKCYSHQNQ